MLDTDPVPSWAGIYVGSLGFATNETLKQIRDFKAPTSFDDLIKPELKGQIVIAHPASSGTSYTFMCTILQIKGEAGGLGVYEKIRAERPDLDQERRGPGPECGQGRSRGRRRLFA